MGIFPTFPWRDAPVAEVVQDGIQAERHSAHDFNTGKTHEAHVPTGCQVLVAIATQELAHLRTTLCEGTDAEDSVDAGDESNKNGRSGNEGICHGSAVCERIATNILEDVEPVTLGNILCSFL